MDAGAPQPGSRLWAVGAGVVAVAGAAWLAGVGLGPGEAPAGAPAGAPPGAQAAPEPDDPRLALLRGQHVVLEAAYRLEQARLAGRIALRTAAARVAGRPVSDRAEAERLLDRPVPESLWDGDRATPSAWEALRAFRAANPLLGVAPDAPVSPGALDEPAR